MARITKLRALKHMAAQQAIITDRSSSSSPPTTTGLPPHPEAGQPDPADPAHGEGGVGGVEPGGHRRHLKRPGGHCFQIKEERTIAGVLECGPLPIHS